MHSLWTYLHQIIKTRLRDFRLAGIFEIFFILLHRLDHFHKCEFAHNDLMQDRCFRETWRSASTLLYSVWQRVLRSGKL